MNGFLAQSRRTVVPRKGDVDRNFNSPRGKDICVPVVPRKGDVDRNSLCDGAAGRAICRPPQGGRG